MKRPEDERPLFHVKGFTERALLPFSLNPQFGQWGSCVFRTHQAPGQKFRFCLCGP